MAGRSNSALGSASLVVLLALLTLPAVTTRFYASDEVELFAWLRSLAFDRDADFQNEYQHFYDAGGPVRNAGFHQTFLEGVNEAGRRRNFTPIGTALLWAPFFALGHLWAITTGAAADGFSQPYLTAVTWGSAVYGGLALALTLAIARRVLGDGLAPTLVVWIGTPLIFYMYVAPGFSHACSAFAVSLFLWTWLRVRGGWTPAGSAALGVVGALMTMVREQDMFFIAGPAIDFARWALRPGEVTPGSSLAPAADRGRRAFAALSAGVIACLLAYTPQLLAYNALNGHPGPTTDVARKMTWSSPHGIEVLFSPEHGLFFWTPLALVGASGLLWLAAGRVRGTSPDTRWIGAVAVVMLALQAYVSGSVESWTVAGSFGQRRFVALTPLLALGLTAWSLTVKAYGSQAVRVGWVGPPRLLRVVESRPDGPVRPAPDGSPAAVGRAQTRA